MPVSAGNDLGRGARGVGRRERERQREKERERKREGRDRKRGNTGRGERGGERERLSKRHPHLRKFKAKSSELPAGRGHILPVADVVDTSQCLGLQCAACLSIPSISRSPKVRRVQWSEVWKPKILTPDSLLSVGLWTSHWISPGLHFLICEMGRIQVPPCLWL